MKKTVNVSAIIIVLLAVAVIGMSFAFATFSANLTINGTATVKSTKWSVHYDSATYGESSGSVAASSKTIDNTSFTFAFTLDEPGDFYEGYVTVKNDGDFNAILNSITMSSLSTDQAKYLTYTVTYGDTPYTATTTGLTTALNSGSQVVVKVKVAYVMPTNASDLPSTNQTVTVTGTLGYTQAA